MSTRGDNVERISRGNRRSPCCRRSRRVIAPEIELLEDVTQLYLTEIGAKPLLTPEEELATARLVRQGDFAARQRMIEHNLRLGREHRQALPEPGHSPARPGRGR